jgi:hypothetical protein
MAINDRSSLKHKKTWLLGMTKKHAVSMLDVTFELHVDVLLLLGVMVSLCILYTHIPFTCEAARKSYLNVYQTILKC